MLIVIAIIAVGVILYFKNKVDNRKVDRHNRLVEKQEKLMEILKEKNTEEDKNWFWQIY